MMRNYFSILKRQGTALIYVRTFTSNHNAYVDGSFLCVYIYSYFNDDFLWIIIDFLGKKNVTRPISKQNNKLEIFSDQKLKFLVLQYM